MKIAVLGAGMVGRAIAADLAGAFEVTAFDVSERNLSLLRGRNGRIQTQRADLRNYEEYNKWLHPFDLVVTAVPGFMGFETLECVIQCGKSVADISFFPEDALQLHELAEKQQVTVITDVGVAPGMSNLILGKHNEEMEILSFECYVGGLPVARHKPFEYKAPFSPIDVIEEYTRPARIKENGTIVTRPAMSEREYIEFEGVGTLEAFNTDGLRSLLFTMPHIPNLKEKTLRYPGHAGLISDLQAAGFFSKKKIVVGGVDVSPLDFTAQILMSNWKLGEDEEELTVMKVIIDGSRNGSAERITYHLLDRYDAETKVSSMARTTGYTCAAAAHLIAQNLFSKKGVYPPELVGNDPSCFNFVMRYLGDRGVRWRKG